MNERERRKSPKVESGGGKGEGNRRQTKGATSTETAFLRREIIHNVDVVML